jgi:hypothetical protein
MNENVVMSKSGFSESSKKSRWKNISHKKSFHSMTAWWSNKPLSPVEAATPFADFAAKHIKTKQK